MEHRGLRVHVGAVMKDNVDLALATADKYGYGADSAEPFTALRILADEVRRLRPGTWLPSEEVRNAIGRADHLRDRRGDCQILAQEIYRLAGGMQ